MSGLPCAIIMVLRAFAPRFSKRVFEHAKLLLAGAIRAPRHRTVAAVWRVLGKSAASHVQHDHRVFNRARWSSLDARRMLLGLLLEAFVPKGLVVMGLDETLARRRGEQISAQGIYRDPVRASHAHVVKTSGLRWVSLMLLTRLPWADRVWALPSLTVLAPSERYYPSRGRQAQSLLDRARQALRLVRRWLPTRARVVVGDTASSALEWLDAVRQAAYVITRLRLAAALYAPAPPRRSRQNGRPRKKGVRLPTLAQMLTAPVTVWNTGRMAPWYGRRERCVQITSATAVGYHSGLPPVPIRWVLVRDPAGKRAPQAWLATTRDLDPVQLLTWFVPRWQRETTVEEARAHLGLETPRQGHDRSVSRTTPALFGLYAIVTLAAARLIGAPPVPGCATAWYPKPQATFSETMALVRRSLWHADHFSMSHAPTELAKIPLALLERLTETLCDAA